MDPEVASFDMNWFFWLWKYDRNKLFREYMSESTRSMYRVHLERYKDMMHLMQPPVTADGFLAVTIRDQMYSYINNEEQQKLTEKFTEDATKALAEAKRVRDTAKRY